MKSFTGNFTPIARKRILADRRLTVKNQSDFNENYIYFNFNKDLIDNKLKMLIIGSNDIQNPYFGGFFMFDGMFPDQYPFFPPKILAKTQGDNMRFHPNYYVNGKCCLSILGTWSGPPWTSCQNICSIAHSLKSLFIMNPITQEPGYQNCKKELSDTYSLIVKYKVLEIAVLRMLENPPEGFECFLPQMKKLFIQLYEEYIKSIDYMIEYNNKIIMMPFYSRIKVKIDLETLKTKFNKKYHELK